MGKACKKGVDATEVAEAVDWVATVSQVDRENALFMFADANALTLVREGDDAGAVYVVMPMRVSSRPRPIP